MNNCLKDNELRQIKLIIASIAVARDLSVDLLISKSCKSDVARYRQEGMWLARKLTKATFTVIGAAFGGRDHTSAQHGVRKIDTLVSSNADYARELLAIAETIGAMPEPKFVSITVISNSALNRMKAEAEVLRRKTASQQRAIEDLEKRLAKARKQPAKAANVPVDLPSAAPVIEAYDRLQQDRFGKRERFAMDRLLTSLSHLKAELSPAAKGQSS